jgi:hypothetical protein
MSDLKNPCVENMWCRPAVSELKKHLGKKDERYSRSRRSKRDIQIHAWSFADDEQHAQPYRVVLCSAVQERRDYIKIPRSESILKYLLSTLPVHILKIKHYDEGSMWCCDFPAS